MFIFMWLGKVINDLIYAATNDPPGPNEITFGRTLTEIRETRAQVRTVLRFAELGLKKQARDKALEIPIRSLEDRENLARLLEAIGAEARPAFPETVASGPVTVHDETVDLIRQGAFLQAVSKARDLRDEFRIRQVADAAIAAGALKDLQVMYTDPALAEILGPQRRAHLAR